MKFTKGQSLKVVKNILLNNKINQRKIERETNVSLGRINEICAGLSEMNILKKRGLYYYMSDPFELLQVINYERPLNKLEIGTIKLPYNTIKECESYLSKTLDENNVKYAYTGFSGLKTYYEYHISYPLIHLYLDNEDFINKIEIGQGPIPVIFLKIDNEDVINQSKEVDGKKVCDKIQVAIDLFSSGLGKDAAYHFMKVIRNER